MTEIVRPTTVAEASSIVTERDGDAKFIGGGTALVLLLKLRMLDPAVLVSLDRLGDVAGWREITATERELRIGGGVTMADLARHPDVIERAPALASAAGVVGNTRIRNAATVGGLLAEADYASDPPAVLVALDAQVEMQSRRGRRTLPVRDFLSDFFTTELAEDEVVTAVSFAAPGPGSAGVYLKFCSRSAEDRPCVGVAAQGRFEGRTIAALDVAVGAVSGRPQIFPDAVTPHLGSELDDRTIDEIADAYASSIDPIDDHRGSAWYRREVVRAQVGRALRSLRGHGDG